MLPARVAQAVMALSFAAPCFSMGLRLLDVWRDPMAVENGRWVRLGVGIFVLEFILLHAGIMLGGAAAAAGTAGGKLGATLGLTALYAVFAGAIALGFQSRMLFMSFFWMVLGRLVGLLVGISGQDQALFLAHSLVGMLLYFAMVVSSVVLPWPRRGITELVAAETRVPNASGLWVEQPHRAIGPGAIYFLLLGAVEVGLMTWVDPHAFAPR